MNEKKNTLLLTPTSVRLDTFTTTNAKCTVDIFADDDGAARASLNLKVLSLNYNLRCQRLL